MTKPLFSILIANYNNSIFIEEAIKSVYKQIYINWEIIIVDDASTDNSLEIIKRMACKEGRIKLYANASNAGCGYTKMKCVEMASGSICGFLDPDDALSSDALSVMITYHEKYPNASFIYSNHYLCNEFLQNPQQIIKSKIPRESNYLESGDSILTHFATFKRAEYNKTIGIDDSLKRAVDQDLYYKMEEVGDVIYIENYLYYYRLHQKGISTFSNSYKAYAWHLYVMMQACKRRNISFENIISSSVEQTYNKNLKGRIDYRIGHLLIAPFLRIKNFLKNGGIKVD